MAEGEEEQSREPEVKAAAPKNSGLNIGAILPYLLPILGSPVTWICVLALSIAIATSVLGSQQTLQTPDYSGEAGGLKITGPLTFPMIADEAAAGSCLSAYIQKKEAGSPLRDMGAAFVAAGKGKSVHPALMVAMAGAESSFATNGLAKSHPDAHNYRGKTSAASTCDAAHNCVLVNNIKFVMYDSWESDITDQARDIKENYFDEGRTTVASIGSKYAPSGALNDPTGLNNNWVKNVSKFISEIGSACPTLKIDYTTNEAYGATVGGPLGSMIYFSQADSAWGSKNSVPDTNGKPTSTKFFGSGSSLSSVGCGITSAAMVTSFLKKPVTPLEMAIGTRTNTAGYDDFGNVMTYMNKQFGIRTTQMADVSPGGNFPIDQIQTELKKNMPVVMQIVSGGGGCKTACAGGSHARGHFVVIVGVDGGNFIVNDPSASRDSKNRPSATYSADSGNYLSRVRFYKFST